MPVNLGSAPSPTSHIVSTSTFSSNLCDPVGVSPLRLGEAPSSSVEGERREKGERRASVLTVVVVT